MTVRVIPSLPVSAVIQDEGQSREATRNNKNSMIIQNNVQFMSSPVTGNDGTVYSFVNSNERHGYNDSGVGFKNGNPALDATADAFYIRDKVGAAGAYIVKVGYGTSINHRWLRGVVGFEARLSTWGDSTSSINKPWIGRIGLLYVNPLSGQEFIYRPTVAMTGAEGDFSNKVLTRISRKVPWQSDPWFDILDLNLLFTGLIIEWGHGAGGGAVPTTLYLYIASFKPIFAESRTGPNPGVKPLNDIKSYELLPSLRPFSERDDIYFDGINV